MGVTENITRPGLGSPRGHFVPSRQSWCGCDESRSTGVFPTAELAGGSTPRLQYWIFWAQAQDLLSASSVTMCLWLTLNIEMFFALHCVLCCEKRRASQALECRVEELKCLVRAVCGLAASY